MKLSYIGISELTRLIFCSTHSSCIYNIMLSFTFLPQHVFQISSYICCKTIFQVIKINSVPLSLSSITPLGEGGGLDPGLNAI